MEVFTAIGHALLHNYFAKHSLFGNMLRKSSWVVSICYIVVMNFQDLFHRIQRFNYVR